MFRVEYSLEEFENYEEAETELLETMDVEDILDYMDCNCEEILLHFLRRKSIVEFEAWLSKEIDKAIERINNDLIIEYEDEEDD